MTCVDCKWWKRNTVPEWEPRNPGRWAQIVAKDPNVLNWGRCERGNTDQFHIEYYDLETRDTFYCARYEALPTAGTVQ